MRFALGLIVIGWLGWAAAVCKADPSGGWQQFDEADGIALYRLDKPNEELPGFRGEAVFEAPLARIVEVLRDVEHHTEWMHRCAVSKIVRQISDERAIIYNRTDVPWPVADRDVVLDTRFRTEADGKLVILTFEDTDPSLHASTGRIVRMPRLAGFYRLWQLGPTRTKVVYQVEADIGGRVPAWISERVTRDMPYETLSRLRERVTTP